MSLVALGLLGRWETLVEWQVVCPTPKMPRSSVEVQPVEGGYSAAWGMGKGKSNKDKEKPTLCWKDLIGEVENHPWGLAFKIVTKLLMTWIIPIKSGTSYEACCHTESHSKDFTENLAWSGAKKSSLSKNWGEWVGSLRQTRHRGSTGFQTRFSKMWSRDTRRSS